MGFGKGTWFIIALTSPCGRKTTEHSLELSGMTDSFMAYDGLGIIHVKQTAIILLDMDLLF